ncbi:MAG: DUF262 domain-containing protein [Symbiobacteriaceae bacterium]|nr:DUF262 domain-containing protein [Symbiobacteriaceae bacterium]
MAIRSTIEKHTINWLKRQDTDGLLNKNISIQRKEVWDHEKKSNLIISVLLDIPIESLLFEETDEGSHNVLDGKQRTLTLCSFIEDGFPLSEKIRVKEIDGIILKGMRFSMLPEVMRNRILEYELSIAVLRALDTEERTTVFFMRNQAVSLTKMDLSIVMLGEHAMDILYDLCNHNFMLSKVKLTAPARRKHDDLRVILQYLMLCKRPEAGFSGTEIMNLCDDIKNGEIKIDREEIIKVLDYLDAALEEKRQYLKKIHVPIVLYVAQAAVQKKITPEDFQVRIDKFFLALPDDPEYVAACTSGSAKRSNVQFRVRGMMQILNSKK